MLILVVILLPRPLIQLEIKETNMATTLNLTPLVVIANRIAGNYGIGEVVNIACDVRPAAPGIGGLGGVVYKIKEGSGALTAANVALGTVTFTASGKAEVVKIAAYAGNNPNQELAMTSLTIVAPTGLKFTKASNVYHNNGIADAGFRGNIALQPSGVSYQNLMVREGDFKGKGSGYYAVQNNLTHPVGAAINVINGNAVNGIDTIYSGIQGAPWSIGSFEWYIPWQYQMAGAAAWTTFAYATHTQSITAIGAVSIAKHNTGPFTTKPSDPNQAY